jgi:outer membrane protein assembly factor BamA
MGSETVWILAPLCLALALEAASSRTVSAIRSVGLKQTKEKLVRDQLAMKPGTAFNPESKAEDIRPLDRLGILLSKLDQFTRKSIQSNKEKPNDEFQDVFARSVRALSAGLVDLTRTGPAGHLHLHLHRDAGTHSC